MFRGTGSKLSAANDLWLVIVDGYQSINLLCMKTFQLVGDRTAVEDVYHISQDEFENCSAPLNMTLSDFNLDVVGMKQT